MQIFILKLIYPNFFYEPTVKSPNWNINYLNNSTIEKPHRSIKKNTKLKFVIDKSKEILALTIERSYEEVQNNYA